MSAIERASWLTLVMFAMGLGALGCEDPSSADRALAASERDTPPTAPSTKTSTSPAAPAAPGTASDPSAADPARSAAPPADDAEAGLADYQIYCASCHGPSGGGDGPIAPTLPVQPAKHNDGNYMNTLDDEYLFKVIAEGGPAVGKSEMMAPWGGSLSDAQIRNLIAFIRSLANPAYSD
jgi:mono/diheme cytochrome c family protein